MRSIALLLLFASSLAGAADYRPFETTDQARQRQSAENYDTYRNNGNQPPLGGYSRPLGDVEQRGVERPGYTSPGSTYQPSRQQPNYGNESWRDSLKR
jgi:hypothetical protein